MAMKHISLRHLAAAIPGIFICPLTPLLAQNDNPTGKAGYFNGNSNTAGSFDPHTANATRTIVDLTVPGAIGAYPLQWSRTMNSRHTVGPSYSFGSGGSWQHSYGWDIDWASRAKYSPRPQVYIVYYPDGRRVDFEPRTSSPIDPLTAARPGLRTDSNQSRVAGLASYC